MIFKGLNSIENIDPGVVNGSYRQRLSLDPQLRFLLHTDPYKLLWVLQLF